jgi:hypothetical protein
MAWHCYLWSLTQSGMIGRLGEADGCCCGYERGQNGGRNRGAGPRCWAAALALLPVQCVLWYMRTGKFGGGFPAQEPRTPNDEHQSRNRQNNGLLAGGRRSSGLLCPRASANARPGLAARARCCLSDNVMKSQHKSHPSLVYLSACPTSTNWNPKTRGGEVDSRAEGVLNLNLHANSG